jgi:tetratricopeptide (TPR) repeat protein
MNFRFRAALVLGVALFAGGCASSGESRAPESSLMAGAEGEDLPEWVQALPPGTEPRDNDHTTQASLFLLQAPGSSTDEQRIERYEEALMHAQAGIEADPGNPQSYYQAGEALLGLDRLEEAVAMFDRAEEIYPRYIIETVGYREEAWIEAYNQGVEQVQAGDQEAAVASFERAGIAYQNRPEAYLNLGSIYAEMGRYEESAEAFAQVIEVVEGPWADRVDEATQAEWMGMLGPARTNRAQLLIRLERYEDAAAIYADLVEEDPDNLDYLTAYASALVAGGQGESASELFDDLLSREGLDASDYFTIGVGLYQVEEFAGAVEAFRMSYEVVPDHRDTAFNLAQSLYLIEAWEELAAVSEKLLEVDELNELAYRFRANALLQLGQEDDAMEVYTTGEDLPIVMDELGLRAGGADLVLYGLLSNLSAEPGTELTLAFTFYNTMGATVGTAETSVRFEAVEEAREFEVAVPGEEFFGYSYRVVR